MCAPVLIACASRQELNKLRASLLDARMLRAEARRIAKEGDALLASLREKVKSRQGNKLGVAQQKAGGGRGEGGLCEKCGSLEEQVLALKAEAAASGKGTAAAQQRVGTLEDELAAALSINRDLVGKVDDATPKYLPNLMRNSFTVTVSLRKMQRNRPWQHDARPADVFALNRNLVRCSPCTDGASDPPPSGPTL